MLKPVHQHPIPSHPIHHAIFPHSAEVSAHHRNVLIAAIAMGLLGTFQTHKPPQVLIGTLAFILTSLVSLLIPSVASALALVGSIYIVCLFIFVMLKLFKFSQSN